ncbi:MAG: thiamine diphosphokinase, partial [Coriobacteriia bacterium]|nr:thiamine diphosphokinase [Coriobacteriia bacterium]
MNALIICPLFANTQASYAAKDKAAEHVHTSPPATADIGTLADYQLLVAVDGGAAWFYVQNLVPDLAVGDFDSIDPEVLAWLIDCGVERQQVSSDKDFSDLELALQLCADRGATSAYIVGAVGGRLDHQLTVLGALARSDISQQRLTGEGQDIVLLRCGQELELCKIARDAGRTPPALPHPQTFSVISLEPARVSITGARWDLDQVQLEPLSTLG